MDHVLTFVAALAGGLGAGWATVELGTRRERKASANRLLVDQQIRREATEIQAALAQLLGALAMQATGEADRHREGSRLVDKAKAKLAVLGVDLPE